jgi:hypothetical protein
MEELLGEVFCMPSVPRLYNEGRCDYEGVFSGLVEGDSSSTVETVSGFRK